MKIKHQKPVSGAQANYLLVNMSFSISITSSLTKASVCTKPWLTLVWLRVFEQRVVRYTMRRFIVAMTNQVERINVSHYATMNNKTSVKHNWRCFKSWSVIGLVESVRVQSDYVLKIQKINAMCGRASLRKLRGPAKGGCRYYWETYV